MRIQGPDGATAKFIAWNLCSDQSFVLVALDDGSLQEWRLNSCRIVEDRKTSDVVGLAATDNQQPHGAAIAEQICPHCKGSGKLPHAADVGGNKLFPGGYSG